MHIRHGNLTSAFEIMKYAVSNKQTQQNLVFNIRAWHFYIDILASLGDDNELNRAYQYVLDTKIATPLTVLNYAAWLQQNKNFEDSFKVYERALKLFQWPHVYEIWVSYLSSFI
jgi:pre-mRNA-splicing factor SYF1